MSSSHLFLGLPIAFLVLYLELRSGLHSPAFFSHLSLGEVTILSAKFQFIFCGLETGVCCGILRQPASTITCLHWRRNTPRACFLRAQRLTWTRLPACGHQNGTSEEHLHCCLLMKTTDRILNRMFLKPVGRLHRNNEEKEQYHKPCPHKKQTSWLSKGWTENTGWKPGTVATSGSQSYQEQWSKESPKGSRWKDVMKFCHETGLLIKYRKASWQKKAARGAPKGKEELWTQTEELRSQHKVDATTRTDLAKSEASENI